MPIRPNPTLSEDLIGEILVRVPVKSLLCFQSVCKAWLSLIKHPAFVKSQLLRTITAQTHQALVQRQPIESVVEEKISLLDFDSRQIVSDLKLPYSKTEPVDRCILVGSVNGIVCIFVYIPAINKVRVYLWNPATRQSKLIPPVEMGFVPAFGYDPIGDDYKLVSFGDPDIDSVKVYSTNRGVWRKALDIHTTRGAFDVCINGLFFGIRKDDMVVFDLHKEVVNCAIKLPVVVRDVDYDEDEVYYHETCIAEFNKSFVVIIMWGKGRNDGQKINIWMLEDDACLGGGGCEASWTPMFSIDLAVRAEFFLAYFNNRDLLVLTQDMWISCNVDKKEAKIVPLSVEIAGHQYSNAVYKYTESLVSLPGFKQISWNADEDDISPADFDIFVPGLGEIAVRAVRGRCGFSSKWLKNSPSPCNHGSADTFKNEIGARHFTVSELLV